MAKKLTQRALMKKLDTLSKEELIKILGDLFKSNKYAEMKMNLLFLGDDYGLTLLEQYKKRLYKIFNPSNIERRGFSLKEAKMVLSDFANISDSDRLYGDLALYFAECATDFTRRYGDIDGGFYKALEKAYHNAVAIACENEEVYEVWKDRLEYVLHEIGDCGWGTEDYIADEYYSLPWVEGEREEDE